MTYLILEIGAVLATMVCVLQLNRKNGWGWAFGVVGAALFFLVFLHENLYFSTGLQVIFLLQSAYGLYLWKKVETDVEPKMIGRWEFIWSVFVVSTFSFALAPYVATLGGENSILDVLTALLSLLATYYLSKKIIQAWYLWSLLNVLLLVLFMSQGLWWASAMEFVLLFVSTEAAFSWRADYHFKQLRQNIRNGKSV
jgi:nicotinamide mononucleotide transporter